jgi:endonuclease-3
MKRQERADRIGEILDDLYPTLEIPLDHRDPFTFLVAVMLSAQTTDKKVNEVTPHLFDAAPTPWEMKKLSVEEIKEYIREIGLSNSKAKRLHKMCRQLIDKHDGNVPDTFSELEDLAGVGHKTASVIMTQAFGKPAFPVDTHIIRLANRWGLSRGNTAAKVEKDIKKVFPKDEWHRRHLQIIYFGREYCPALYHDLSECPICSWAATKKRIREEKKANDERRKR